MVSMEKGRCDNNQSRDKSYDKKRITTIISKVFVASAMILVSLPFLVAVVPFLFFLVLIYYSFLLNAIFGVVAVGGLVFGVVTQIQKRQKAEGNKIRWRPKVIIAISAVLLMFVVFWEVRATYDFRCYSNQMGIIFPSSTSLRFLHAGIFWDDRDVKLKIVMDKKDINVFLKSLKSEDRNLLPGYNQLELSVDEPPLSPGRYDYSYHADLQGPGVVTGTIQVVLDYSKKAEIYMNMRF